MSSAAFGDALAHELPALRGRANAIAPNRVQNGSTRDGDEGGGSARRRLAVEAVRRLAALWSRGPLGRRHALVWCLYFVRAGSEARGQCEAGKPGAYARRVHLLTLDRGERVELLSHGSSGSDAAAGRCVGVGLVSGAEYEFDHAEPIDSGGSWLDDLFRLVDRAGSDLEEDKHLASAIRAQRKAARKGRSQP